MGYRAVSMAGARWVVTSLAVLLYATSLGYGFVFDDSPEVVQNVYIRSLSELPRAFTAEAWSGSGIDNGLYRPLTTLTYAFNYWVSGMQPWSYHLVNVLVHASVGLLVLRLAGVLAFSLRAALISASLFVVHPIHVEAVANIAGRKELLMSLFVLAAVLSFRQALLVGGSWVPLAAAACGAAALSKETGLVAVSLMALLDAVAIGRNREVPGARRVLAYVSCMAVAGSVWLARAAVVQSFGVQSIPYVDNPAAFAPLAHRLMTSIAVLGKSVILMVLPIRLSPDYSYDAIRVVESVADVRFLLSTAGLLVLLVLAARSWPRQRVMLFCVGWFLLCILPAANILVPIGTIFAERLLYLPSIGFFLLVGHGLAKLSRRSAQIVMAVLLLLFSARTLTYSESWRSDKKLFTSAVEVVPRSVKMRYNLGVQLKKEGDLTGAENEFSEALSIYPDYQQAYVNRGNCRISLGDYSAAVADFESALELDPGDLFAWNGRGLARRLSGQYLLAIADFDKALEMRPDYAVALLNRGLAFEGTGDLESAEADYEKALQVAPADWQHLPLLLERRRQVSELLRSTAPDVESQPRVPRRRL